MPDYFSERRLLIDAHLDGIAGHAVSPPSLRPALQAAITSGGKRIRGILTMAVGEAWGVPAPKLLDAAAAFEMIHSCSLIIDDLPSLDDATLRRGSPTIHRQYGEDLAILSAFALLNESYALLARNHGALRPRRWGLPGLIGRVSGAVGWDGTIGGEAVDLHSETATLDFSTLEYIHSRKTGALFVAAGAVGAMLANAPEPGLRSIEAYAKNLGLAFQITDDVLDVVGTSAELGKDTGKDSERLTFVKLAGVEGSRELTGELIETSMKAIEPLGKRGEHLRALALLVRDRTK
ncbi:MAG: polyprenyl synthetase family protein [Acidobacteriota bacterium]